MWLLLTLVQCRKVVLNFFVVQTVVESCLWQSYDIFLLFYQEKNDVTKNNIKDKDLDWETGEEEPSACISNKPQVSK